jgi:hypothetical protein
MAFITKDPYFRPLLQALGLQCLLLLFSGCCGMPPELFVRGCCYASAGFWFAVIVVLVRRPRSPTQGDLAFIRWGLLPIGVFGTMTALFYWTEIVGVLDPKNVRNLGHL